MNVNKFIEKQIPYQVLESFGLTKDMVNDLPMDVLSGILSGQRSPVLPIEVESPEGGKVCSRARFSLTYTDQGDIDVLFHPVLAPIGDTMWVVAKDKETGKDGLREVDTKSIYSDKVVEQLKSGKVVLDYMTGRDGRRLKAFLQLDPETNEVLAVPSPVIGRNLQTLIGELGLTNSESHCLQNGEILTLIQDNHMMAIGLDLNNPTGIRFEEGDEKHWKERSKREWDKYNVGVFGCWVMDDDGVLTYVNEEDYTDEIWEGIERQRDVKKPGASVGRVV